MTLQEFLDEFGTLAESAEGVPKLRELILELAVRGKLVEQDEGEGSGQDVLDAVALEVAELVESKQIKKPKKPATIESKEAPFAIPASWRFALLESVAVNIHYGYTASANHDLSDVLLVRITDIQDNGVAWATVPGCEIDADDVGKYELHDGDLLIARTGGTIGKTFLVDNVPQAAVFASYLIRVVPGVGTCPGYLKRFLECPVYWEQLYAKSAGTGQPNVNATSLKSLVLPLPPLPEQHRIVSKVDELMGLCDRLEAVQGERRGVRVRLNRSSLDRLTSVSGVGARQRGSELSAAWQRVCDHFEVLYDTPETLPDLRQTILQLAVQGKLVPQNPNDEPAEVAVKRMKVETDRLLAEKVIKRPKEMADLDTVGRPFEAPTNWQWVQLSDVLRYGPRNGYSPKPVEYTTPVMSLTLSATTYGRFDGTKTKYIDEEIEPDSHLWLQPGDFLIQRSNSPEYVGITAVYDGPANGFIYPDLMMKFRVAPELEIGFVDLVMKCPFARDYFRTNATGTSGSMRKVNQSIVSAFPMPVPPFSEQKRIVSKVTHLLSQVTRLESTLTRRESTRTQLLTAAIHELLRDA